MKLVTSSLMVAFASSALVAAAPAPARADPSSAKVEAISPERLDLARKFMAVTDTRDTMETVREAMFESVALTNDELDDATMAAAKRHMERYLRAAEPKIRAAMPAILEASAQAYAQEFSAEELRDLIAFAQTPAGRHYIDRYDFVLLTPEVYEAQQKLGEDLQPLLENFHKEMCAEKAAQRIAMGDSKAKCPLAAAAETQAG